MKKFFTLISMVCICAINAMAAKVTTITDIEKAVTDGTVVTLCIDGTYLYGPDAQNTKMGDADAAVSSSNGCVGYKIEKDGDNYMFRCVTPTGGDYFIWGRSECNYLNAQTAVDGVTFNLNPGTQKGTDLENGAVWAFETVEGKLYLKNIGNGAYFAGEKTSETAVEVSVVSIEADPEPVEEEVEILASLKPYVENATVFYLKTGEQYLYGSEAQKCAMGTLDEATAETAAVTGWKLEYQALGGRYFFRAITPAGEHYTHDWAKGEGKFCFLNTQPALDGETFILGKDQDTKDGSSWIVAEVEGGYTIQSKANKGYLKGLGLSETPVVWEIVLPTTTSINTVAVKAQDKAVKAIVNGQLVIVKGNDKFNVAGQLVK